MTFKVGDIVQVENTKESLNRFFPKKTTAVIFHIKEREDIRPLYKYEYILLVKNGERNWGWCNSYVGDEGLTLLNVEKMTMDEVMNLLTEDVKPEFDLKTGLENV